MKWLGLLLASALLASHAPNASAAPTFVQHNATQYNSCTSSYTWAIPTTAAGNWVFGSLLWESNPTCSGQFQAVTVNGITATVGGSAGQVGGPTETTFFAPNVPAGTAITFTATGGTILIEGFQMTEFSGIPAASTLDTNAHKTTAVLDPGTATDALSSGSVTPGTAGEFFYGAGTIYDCTAGRTLSAGTGWTLGGTLTTGSALCFPMTDEYRVQPTTASLAATFTLSLATHETWAGIIGIALASTPPPGPFTFQTQLTVAAVIQGQQLSNSIMTAPASGTVGTLTTNCSTQSACTGASYAFTTIGTGCANTKNADFLLGGTNNATLSVNASGPDAVGGALPAGTYPLGISSNVPGLYGTGTCFNQNILVNPSTATPAIAVNGSTTGTTVASGAAMTVAASHGPAVNTDTMMVCTANTAPLSGNSCYYSGYPAVYLTTCTATPQPGNSAPTSGVASNTCTITAPSANGSYFAVFAGWNGNNFDIPIYASAPFTVGGGSTPSITAVHFSTTGTAAITKNVGFSGTVDSLVTTCSVSPCPGTPTYSLSAGGPPPPNQPTIVQSQSNTNVPGSGTTCSWSVPAITAGNTIVGFNHTTNSNDTAEDWPTSVTDNVGNTYTLTPHVNWQPWPEDLLMFYALNVTGNPTTFTFSGFQTANPICNIGFTEYANAHSIVVIPPLIQRGATPGVTITPLNDTAHPSLVWVFGAGYVDGPGQMTTPGYNMLLDNTNFDGIGVWGSATATSSAQTLTFTNPNGTPGSCSPYDANGCSQGIMAAAVSTAVQTGGGACTPAGAPCPSGVAAPSGFHWNLTFDDEFYKDSSIDQTRWFIYPGPSNLTDGSITLDSTNGLKLQPSLQPGTANYRVGVETFSNTNNCQNVSCTQFFQRFGFWEINAALPTDVSGEGDGLHSDIWQRALTSGATFTNDENDINESILGTGNQTTTSHNWGDDSGGGNSQTYPNPADGLLSGFHNYGLYWANDGTAHGSHQLYFDGTAQYGPQQYLDPNWDNGVVIILTLDGCTGNSSNGSGGPPFVGAGYCQPQGVFPPTNTSPNNPFKIRYVRIWQLVPG